MMKHCIYLARDREKSLVKRHPWVFSGAVGKVTGSPGPGDTVAVLTAKGDFLAWAAYSPSSQIRARVWSFDESELIDGEFIGRRVSAAIAAREAVMGVRGEAPNGNARRIVSSEADFLPGYIADVYGDVAVVQSLSAGSERFKGEFARAVAEVEGVRWVYERSDADARRLEGLPVVCGPVMGGEPPEPVEIVEYSSKYIVDVRAGHKTGFYLDQRENRARVAAMAGGRRVLNCFSYTGGFSIAAMCAGAAGVVSVDSSAPALEIARRNAALNELDAATMEWRCNDVFDELRRIESSGEEFDLIVLDPPKFAARKEQVKKAERAYKDINMLALRVLPPGGVLCTFSCSGAIATEHFATVVAWAAFDSGANAAVIDRLGQPADHPVPLWFPQAEYLKGLVIVKNS